jgi:DNA-binding LacI/PurR family transcriptional regulator
MKPDDITMSDIAREAGVSRATASYVLNGRDTAVRISDETRRRVLGAAEALGYRRNDLARAVVTGHSRVVGVVARSPGPEPKARILEGVLEEAAHHDYFVKLLHHPAGEPAAAVSRRCVEQRLAGVIVMRPSQVALADLHDELARYGVPVVLVDDAVTREGTVGVTSDDVAGCRRAVEHLAGLGHRRLAQIEGRREPNPLQRASAFATAVCERGMRVSERRVVFADWDAEETERTTRSLFRRRRGRPTALFVSAGDAFAAVAVRTLRRMGLRVPQDVSVVGYGDLLLAACTDPPLTTVAQPFEEIGRVAVRRLIVPDGGGTDARTAVELMPTRLVVRGSTAPAPPV